MCFEDVEKAETPSATSGKFIIYNFNTINNSKKEDHIGSGLKKVRIFNNLFLINIFGKKGDIVLIESIKSLLL